MRLRRRRHRAREQEALEIHDGLVQGLTEAQLALDVGRPEQAREAIDRSLAAARRLVTTLLDDGVDSSDLRPGDLRRRTAADGSTPDR